MVVRSIADYSARIEKIAERVSEDVHAKNDQSYREAWGGDHPDVLEHVGAGIAQHTAPRGCRRRHAKTKEAETRFDQDHAAEPRGVEHDEGRGDRWQDVPENDVPVTGAEGTSSPCPTGL